MLFIWVACQPNPWLARALRSGHAVCSTLREGTLLGLEAGAKGRPKCGDLMTLCYTEKRTCKSHTRSDNSDLICVTSEQGFSVLQPSPPS